MPTNFKKLVTARMAQTGENWQAAARHVRAQEFLARFRSFTDELRARLANPTLAARVAAMFAVGTEFPSEDALKDYLHEHPNADKSKHTVKKDRKEEGEGGATDWAGEAASALDAGEKPKSLLKDVSQMQTGRGRDQKAQGLFKEVKKRWEENKISDDEFGEFEEAYKEADLPKPHRG